MGVFGIKKTKTKKLIENSQKIKAFLEISMHINLGNRKTNRLPDWPIDGATVHFDPDRPDSNALLYLAVEKIKNGAEERTRTSTS